MASPQRAFRPLHFLRAGRLALAGSRVLLFVIGLCLLLQPVAVSRASVLTIGGDFDITDEIELGRKFELLVKSRLPLIEDPEIADYVRDVVQRIVDKMPPQAFTIKTSVIRHPAINAFAAPAGFVFINSGLILNFDTESEMAAVIAHELAHVSQRHIARSIEQMQTLSLLSMVGILAGIFLGGENAGDIAMGAMGAVQAAQLKYSRDHEREADQVGMNYLVNAGYPPRAMPEAFEIILRKQWLGGGGTIPTYLSTHPGLKERMGYLEQRVVRLPKDVQDRKVDNSRFRRVRMLLRARYSDPKVALQHFQEHVEDDPFLASLGQAIAYERLHMVSKAGEAFDKAQQLKPEDQLLTRELGIFNFKHGKFDLAAQYLQKAVFQSPDDLMALFFYARMLTEMGEPGQAVDYYRRIVHKLPEDAEVHYYLGRALGEDRQYFEAHLHLAYSSMYSQDMKKLRFHMDKAERLAVSKEQQDRYKEFEDELEERKEFW